MAKLTKVDKDECIAALEKEGFNFIEVRQLPPSSDNHKHGHPFFQVNIIISGELTIIDKHGSKTYITGERIEVEAGTIHIAKGCPEGGEMVTAMKIPRGNLT